MAAALTGQDAPLLDTVTALVDKSLLVPVEQVGEEPRFGMLETVASMAWKPCVNAERRRTATRPMPLITCGLPKRPRPTSKAADSNSCGSNGSRGSRRTCVRPSPGCSSDERLRRCSRLSGALWWYWNLRGSSSEALEWLQSSAQLPDAEEPTVARAKALCGAGFLTVYLHSPRREGLALLEQSLATRFATGRADDDGRNMWMVCPGRPI